MTYVKYNSNGSIAMSADWPFPDSEKVNFNVVRGYDGKLYREGTEPTKPEELVREENFAYLRQVRDDLLKATDYLLMPDYPISEDKLVEVKEYRQKLRDLPNQEDAPWTPDTIPLPESPLV